MPLLKLKLLQTTKTKDYKKKVEGLPKSFGYLKKIYAISGLSTVAVTTVLLTKVKQIRHLKQVVNDSAKQLNYTFLIKNKFYKGLRYSKKLPVRGQRTRTNARTSRRLPVHIL